MPTPRGQAERAARRRDHGGAARDRRRRPRRGASASSRRMQAWVDAVNATDNPAAHAHASPSPSRIALLQRGVEPIMQLVCRDRNRLALQADIVGAALHGIENICCLTGDDVTAGDEPEATPRLRPRRPAADRARRAAWRAGRYLSGRAIEPAPHLFIGAVENPGAPPLDYRAERGAEEGRRRRALPAAADLLRRPSARGVRGRGRRDRADRARARCCPSICLVRSARALRFMDEQVPGIEVPPRSIERVEARRRPAARVLRPRRRAGRPRAVAARRRAACTSSRSATTRGIAELCTRLGIEPRAEREQPHAHRPAVAV